LVVSEEYSILLSSKENISFFIFCFLEEFEDKKSENFLPITEINCSQITNGVDVFLNFLRTKISKYLGFSFFLLIQFYSPYNYISIFLNVMGFFSLIENSLIDECNNFVQKQIEFSLSSLKKYNIKLNGRLATFIPLINQKITLLSLKACPES